VLKPGFAVGNRHKSGLVDLRAYQTTGRFREVGGAELVDGLDLAVRNKASGGRYNNATVACKHDIQVLQDLSLLRRRNCVNDIEEEDNVKFQRPLRRLSNAILNYLGKRALGHVFVDKVDLYVVGIFLGHSKISAGKSV